MAHNVLLALGANIAGLWGQPQAALERAITELSRRGVQVRGRAPLYVTRPVGRWDQPDFVNTVVVGTSVHTPQSIMAIAKRLERAAGRKPGPRNGPRPLDVDLIAYGGVVCGWPPPPAGQRLGQLILPHPELHRRAFVLRPLVDVASDWVHPVLRKPARTLLRALAPSVRGDLAPLAGPPA